MKISRNSFCTRPNPATPTAAAPPEPSKAVAPGRSLSRSQFRQQIAAAFVALAATELSTIRGLCSRRSRILSRWSDWLAGCVSEATTEIGVTLSTFAAGKLDHTRETKLAKSHTVSPSADAPSSVQIIAAQPPPVAPDSRGGRKLALLKRAGLFCEGTGGARIGRAATLEDLRKAYRLVHDVYLGTGYIHPEPAGMRIRIFETSSNTATFVAKANGQVVGVLSIVGDSPESGLPSDSAFKPELDALRAKKKRLCEATNQAVAEAYRKSAVPTELMRCAVAHMTNAGYDEAIATVSPSHNGFYELLGFREIGGQRSYSGKIHDPVVALSMDVNQYRRPPMGTGEVERFIHSFLAAENHYLVYVNEWDKHAQRQFLNVDLLQQLFVRERNFIEECSPAELQVLHRRWGRELFSAVTGSLFLPASEPEPVPPQDVEDERTDGASFLSVDRPTLESSGPRGRFLRAPFSSRMRSKFQRVTRRHKRSESPHRVSHAA